MKSPDEFRHPKDLVDERIKLGDRMLYSYGKVPFSEFMQMIHEYEKLGGELKELNEQFFGK